MPPLNEADLSFLPGTTVKITKIRAGKLREAAAANPEHPISVIFVNAVKNFDDNRIVNVETLDLEAIAKNMDVTFEEVVVDYEGGKALDSIKKLVPRKAAAAAPTPTPTPKKSP